MGPNDIILVFLNVEFQASFFTLIKRLFSSSSLSAIRVVSSAYLRLGLRRAGAAGRPAGRGALGLRRAGEQLTGADRVADRC